jgi:hypothetical protein
MHILDLGGTPHAWRMAPIRPAHITMVNLDPVHSDKREEWITYLNADACEPPFNILSAKFDLVYSNSLLEHVGGYDRRRRLAEFVQSLADHYWVQTPYRYFPIEPHWLFPGFQFLPLRIRSRISRSWPYGHIRSDPANAVSDVASIELIDIAEMRHLFPGATVWRERFGGLTKSIVAIE